MATLASSQHGRPVVPQRLVDIETILMLCERDVVRFIRERAQLYGSLARTVVWLFVLGAGLRGSITIPGNTSYLAYVFPGMLAMAVTFATVQGSIIFLFAPLAGVHLTPFSVAACILVMLLSGLGLTAIGLCFAA